MAKKPTNNDNSDSSLVTTTPAGSELAASNQSQAQAVAFVQSPENIELLKSSLSATGTNLTDNELGLFLYQAQKTGLDPLARQIYVMKRGQGGVTFMTSIDGQRLVAQRTHEYDGQTPPEWCGADGKWREVWLENGDPAAARVGVYRQGMREPVYGIATWKSYNQGKGQWTKMGDVMLAKCAEALALRKAFPQELSGLYTAEEIDQNGPDAPEPPRVMTAQEALARAGKNLIDKGFSRDEAFTIMMGIADVDEPEKLTGNVLKAVIDVVEREDAEALSLYIPTDQDDAPEAEVIPPAADKSVEQAMQDGDSEPPASFLAPEPETPATPKWVVPDWGELGQSKIPRPEMRKLYKEMIAVYAPTEKAAKAFCKSAISKDAPTLADDFITVCNILADELNAMAEQGTLV